MASDPGMSGAILVAATSTDPAFVRAAYLRIASIGIGVYEYVLRLSVTTHFTHIVLHWCHM